MTFLVFSPYVLDDWDKSGAFVLQDKERSNAVIYCLLLTRRLNTTTTKCKHEWGKIKNI